MANYVKDPARAIDRLQMERVAGQADSAARGIAFGPQLMHFAEALLQAADATVLVDAAGVAANFQRMVRIADATGIPVDDMHSELGREVRAALDLARFGSARHSLG